MGKRRLNLVGLNRCDNRPCWERYGELAPIEYLAVPAATQSGLTRMESQDCRVLAAGRTYRGTLASGHGKFRTHNDLGAIMQLMTLDYLVADYVQALVRLESWGVRVQNTRLATYLKLLRHAADRERAGDERHQADERFRNAVIEAADIVDIARLDGAMFEDDHVIGKLNRISDGREFADDEGPDQARDCAFEFACAGDLHAQGRFGGFSVDVGDVLVASGLWPVECKRISSLDRLPQRLRKARDQLQRGFETGSPPGFIAIDLSRPIRRAHGHLAAPSDEALCEATSTMLTAYLREHLMHALDPGEIARPGVLGAMVRHVSVGTAGEIANIRRSTTWQVVCVHADDTAENALFLDVAVLGGPVPMIPGTREELFSACKVALA